MNPRAAGQRLLNAIGHDRLAGGLLNRMVLPVFRRLDGAYRTGEALRLHQRYLQELLPDLTVRHGPFRGMRYPRAEAFGSPLFSKLLGSYESELHPWLERILGNRYEGIVDVGCAEGYYAVGLARRYPSLAVHAFDTDEPALRFCGEMAELNGVADRVTLRTWCDWDTLLETVGTGAPWLIVADVEGYEKELFREGAGQALSHHEILVETHDIFDITISSTLRSRFAGTHHVQSVQGTADIAKTLACDHPELRGLDLETRKSLIGERRPEPQEWLYFTPRPSDGTQGGAADDRGGGAAR